MLNRKKWIFVSAALVLLAAVFYGGFSLGREEGRGLVANEEGKFLTADFSLFWEALKLVKDKYYDIQNVKDQDFVYGAVSGVLGALQDPYSSFFNPSDAKKFEEDVSGSFGGIGAELGIRDQVLTVIAPLKDNPAEKAGLKAGDRILAVNGTSTAGISVDTAVKLIRGEPNTTVKLLIDRDAFKEPREFDIVRQIIVVPTLDSEMRDGVTIIRLYNFNANAPSLFYQAALSSLLQGTRGVVLDLRNNPGGYLEVAINLAGWFFDRGETVVVEKFGSGPDESQKLSAVGNGALKEVPVVVLVNGGSASAAEILAGALRDNRGIKLVGEKTFGKGSVQEIETLKDGSSVKISIAEWLTPKGASINKTGLAPDIEVMLTEEDAAAGRDPQLERALTILRAETR